MKLTIVIPCYNESQRLDVAAIHDFLESDNGTSLLLVDDGSTDDTPSILQYLHTIAPDRIGVLTLSENRGKAEAVRRGMLEADRLGADYVGFWDADMATPLSAAQQFYDVLERQPEVQIVWGTRLGMLGRRIERRPLRRLLGRVFSRASAIAVGLPIHDALCGAKMFRAGPWLRALFGTPFNSRWIFDVEILARLKAGRRRLRGTSPTNVIFELPLDHWREVDGSRLKPRDFVRAGAQLAGLLVKTRILRQEPACIVQLDDLRHGELRIAEQSAGTPSSPIRHEREAA